MYILVKMLFVLKFEKMIFICRNIKLCILYILGLLYVGVKVFKIFDVKVIEYYIVILKYII